MAIQRATLTAAAPLTVQIDGSVSSVPAVKITTYVPVVNDRVAVETFADGTVIVFGAFA